MTDDKDTPFVRMLFVRKPVAVEAMRWHDTDENRELFTTWFEQHEKEFVTSGSVVILDSGSWMTKVDPGGWIVWDDEQDEFMPYSDAGFRRTHEMPALAQADEAVGK